MQVEHWDPALDGVLSESNLRRRLETEGFAVTRYLYPPGTRFPEHTHPFDKKDAVLSGRFRLTMNGQSMLLEAGDRLLIPRGMVHSAEVVGSEPVISLDASRR